MAKQGTTDTTASKANDDSVIEQSARAVGQLIESGATVMGRGLAAGVEGMTQLKERAAEMTGLTSASARREDCGKRSPNDDDGGAIGGTHGGTGNAACRTQHRKRSKPHGGPCHACSEAHGRQSA